LVTTVNLFLDNEIKTHHYSIFDQNFFFCNCCRSHLGFRKILQTTRPPVERITLFFDGFHLNPSFDSHFQEFRTIFQEEKGYNFFSPVGKIKDFVGSALEE